MNLVCISTDNFVDSHLIRFIRHVKQQCPDCKLYLYYLGNGMDKKFPGLRDNFEQVITRPLTGRPQFNRIRMSATSDFNLDNATYCDIDADFIGNIDDIPSLCGDNTLGFVESPAIHQDWSRICKDKGWDESWEANNGLLYMTEDWGERYDAAVEAVEAYGSSPRVTGTMSFNWMLRENEGWAKLPYEYGTIWWDSEMFLGAKIIQYCNDQGQAKRVTMEEEWRASRVPIADVATVKDTP